MKKSLQLITHLQIGKNFYTDTTNPSPPLPRNSFPSKFLIEDSDISKSLNSSFRVLRYERALRLRGPDALKHAFFDSLRNPDGRLGNGSVFPPLIGINTS